MNIFKSVILGYYEEYIEILNVKKNVYKPGLKSNHKKLSIIKERGALEDLLLRVSETMQSCIPENFEMKDYRFFTPNGGRVYPHSSISWKSGSHQHSKLKLTGYEFGYDYQIQYPEFISLPARMAGLIHGYQTKQTPKEYILIRCGLENTHYGDYLFTKKRNKTVNTIKSFGPFHGFTKGILLGKVESLPRFPKTNLTAAELFDFMFEDGVRRASNYTPLDWIPYNYLWNNLMEHPAVQQLGKLSRQKFKEIKPYLNPQLQTKYNIPEKIKYMKKIADVVLVDFNKENQYDFEISWVGNKTPILYKNLPTPETALLKFLLLNYLEYDINIKEIRVNKKLQLSKKIYEISSH